MPTLIVKPGTIPDDAPRNLRILGTGRTSYSIQWDAPVDLGGLDLIRYELRQSPEPLPGFEWTVPSDETFTDRSAGLSAGQLYFVIVRAVNEEGPGPWSEALAVTPGRVPGQPENFAVNGERGSLNLSWEMTEEARGRLNVDKMQVRVADSIAELEAETRASILVPAVAQPPGEASYLFESIHASQTGGIRVTHAHAGLEGNNFRIVRTPVNPSALPDGVAAVVRDEGDKEGIFLDISSAGCTFYQLRAAFDKMLAELGDRARVTLQGQLSDGAIATALMPLEYQPGDTPGGIQLTSSTQSDSLNGQGFMLRAAPPRRRARVVIPTVSVPKEDGSRDTWPTFELRFRDFGAGGNGWKLRVVGGARDSSPSISVNISQRRTTVSLPRYQYHTLEPHPVLPDELPPTLVPRRRVTAAQLREFLSGLPEGTMRTNRLHLVASDQPFIETDGTAEIRTDVDYTFSGGRDLATPNLQTEDMDGQTVHVATVPLSDNAFQAGPIRTQLALIPASEWAAAGITRVTESTAFFGDTVSASFISGGIVDFSGGITPVNTGDPIEGTASPTAPVATTEANLSFTGGHDGSGGIRFRTTTPGADGNENEIQFIEDASVTEMSIVENRVTFPDGWTLQQLRDGLRAQGATRAKVTIRGTSGVGHLTDLFELFFATEGADANDWFLSVTAIAHADDTNVSMNAGSRLIVLNVSRDSTEVLSPTRFRSELAALSDAEMAAVNLLPVAADQAFLHDGDVDVVEGVYTFSGGTDDAGLADARIEIPAADLAAEGTATLSSVVDSAKLALLHTRFSGGTWTGPDFTDIPASDTGNDNEESYSISGDATTWHQSYAATVRAVNRYGASISTTPLEATIQPGPPSRVTDVRSVARTGETIDLEWSALPATEHAEIIRWEYSYRRAENQSWTVGTFTEAEHAKVTLRTTTGIDAFEIFHSAAGTDGNGWGLNLFRVTNSEPTAVSANAQTRLISLVISEDTNGDVTVGRLRNQLSALSDDVMAAANLLPVASNQQILGGAQTITVLSVPQAHTFAGGAVNDITGNQTAGTITGLRHSRSYQLRVRAVTTGDQEGEFSHEHTGRTAFPPSPVDNLRRRFHDSHDKHCSVEWDPPANDQGDAPITHYRWRHRLVVGGATWSEWTDTTDTYAAVDVSFLTGYISRTRFQVQAVSSIGYGADHPQIGFIESAATPERPVLEADGIDQGVVVNWSVPDMNNAPFIRYEYQTRTVVDNTPSDWTDWTSTPTNNLTITGLNNGTLYDVVVRAVNECGNGIIANSVSFTPNVAPVALTNLRVTRHSRIWARMSWDDTNPDSLLVDSDGNNLWRYQIRGLPDFQPGGGGDSDLLVDLEYSASIGNTWLNTVLAGTRYEVSIRREGSEGWSPWSERVVFYAGRAYTIDFALHTNEDGLSVTRNTTPGSTAVTGDWPIDQLQYRITAPSDVATGWTYLDDRMPPRGGTPIPLDLVLGRSYTVQFRLLDTAGYYSNVETGTAVPGVGAVPSPVRNLVASPLEEGAQLEWDAPLDSGGGDLEIALYQYRYRLTGETWGDWTDVGTLNNTQRLVRLFSLLEQSYDFQVRAGNYPGVIQWSEPSPIVRTTPIIVDVPASPDNFEWRATDTRTLLLTWDNLSLATITRFEWRRRVDNGQWYDWQEIPGSDASTVSFTTEVLDPVGHTHSVQVRAVAEEGGIEANGSPSPIAKWHWLSAIEEFTVSNLGKTGTGARMSWVRLYDYNSVVRYEYRHRQQETGVFPVWDDWQEFDPDYSGGTGRHRRDFDNLTTATAHQFQVRAIGEYDTETSEIGELFLGRTPGAPEMQANIARFGGSVTVTWSTPDDGGYDITSYEYRVQEWDPFSRIWGSFQSDWQTVVGQQNERTFTGLTNGDPYRFHVRAVNQEGAGAVGRVSATPATVPGKPGTTIWGDAIRFTRSAPLTLKLELFVPRVDDGGSDITAYTRLLWTGDDQPPTNLRTFSTLDPRVNDLTAPDDARLSTFELRESLELVNGVWKIEPLKNGKRYNIIVTYYKPFHGYGEPSDVLSVEMGDVPTTPTELRATLENLWDVYDELSLEELQVRSGIDSQDYDVHYPDPGVSVHLAWVPSDVRGSNLTRMQIRVRNLTDGDDDEYISLSPRNDDRVTTRAAYTYKVPDNQVGKSLTFAVRFASGFGWSEWAETEEVVPSHEPGVPDGLRVVPGDGKIHVSWIANTNNGGDPIDGYSVTIDFDGAGYGGGYQVVPLFYERATSSIWAPVDSVNELGTSGITAKGLLNGASHFVRVSGANKHGSGRSIRFRGVIPQKPITPPDNLRYSSVSEDAATLFWDHGVVYRGERIAYAFQSEAIYGNDGWHDEADNIDSKLFTGLAAGTSYSVKIRARDEEGTESFSEGLTFSTSASGVGPVTGFSMTPTATGFDLSWDEHADSRVSGYQYRSRKGFEDAYGTSWTNVNGRSTTSVAVTIPAADRGEVHTFQIRGLIGGSLNFSGSIGASQRGVPNGTVLVPENLAVIGRSEEITVSVDAPYSSEYTHLQTQYRERGGTWSTDIDTSVQASIHPWVGRLHLTIPSLVNHTTYEVRTRFLRPPNNGAWTDYTVVAYNKPSEITTLSRSFAPGPEEVLLEEVASVLINAVGEGDNTGLRILSGWRGELGNRMHLTLIGGRDAEYQFYNPTSHYLTIGFTDDDVSLRDVRERLANMDDRMIRQLRLRKVGATDDIIGTETLNVLTATNWTRSWDFGGGKVLGSIPSGLIGYELTWTEPDEVIDYYQVFTRDSNNRIIDVRDTDFGSPGATATMRLSYDADVVAAGTGAKFYIRAVNSLGPGPISDAVNARLEDEALRTIVRTAADLGANTWWQNWVAGPGEVGDSIINSAGYLSSGVAYLGDLSPEFEERWIEQIDRISNLRPNGWIVSTDPNVDDQIIIKINEKLDEDGNIEGDLGEFVLQPTNDNKSWYIITRDGVIEVPMNRRPNDLANGVGLIAYSAQSLTYRLSQDDNEIAKRIDQLGAAGNDLSQGRRGEALAGVIVARSGLAIIGWFDSIFE